MAHRKTGSTRTGVPARRVWDGLTKELNPFSIGIDPGIDLDTPVSHPHDDPGKVMSVNPATDSRKGRKRGSTS